jgi:hypothetical protein
LEKKRSRRQPRGSVSALGLQRGRRWHLARKASLSGSSFESKEPCCDDQNTNTNRDTKTEVIAQDKRHQTADIGRGLRDPELKIPGHGTQHKRRSIPHLKIESQDPDTRTTDIKTRLNSEDSEV